MSRGGRGGGRGGKRTGPDMSWQDEDAEPTQIGPIKRVPAPVFPHRELAVPKPLSTTEKSHVQSLLSVRDRIRRGPLYTILEPSSLLDNKGKRNPRAGFDPFNDQERYTKKYHRKRRVIPDLTERGGYTLKLFPVELWPILDPRRKQKEYWNGLSDEVKERITGRPSSTSTNKESKKRKRQVLQFTDHDDDDDNAEGGGSQNGGDSGSEDSDEDTILTGNKRRRKTANKTRRKDPSQSKAKEKKGLDAEDDYPDVDQSNKNKNKNKNATNDDNNDLDDNEAGGVGADEEPMDSEYGSDDEDDAGDDYNAENYFDAGDDDDMGDDGGMMDDGDGDGGGGDIY